ncbi:serine hydrolase domain-containing protein [Bradyrhizobium acaciae]|uniref:serine hydrolase domain-containing protein n=1 Tax=Bradyrhizobium acaciae TaxID=2683706 RepID=UPI001E426BB5|nr:serine hydrolase [Bradyrhizobium acaciae]
MTTRLIRMKVDDATDQDMIEDGSTLEFNGRKYLDGRASDPLRLGWMQGSPPPEDKRITFESGRFFEFPRIRWSLSHMRELMPTVCVRRGSGAPTSFESAPAGAAAAIEQLTFKDLNGREYRWEESLHDTYTDAIVVLHRGRVVYERYLGSAAPFLPQECGSVTKSYTGTLASLLVHERVLDSAKSVSYYVPELDGTAWEDASLRQVMDMETSLSYTEDFINYDDRQSDIWFYRFAMGRWPRPAHYEGPKTICDFLRTVRKVGVHGEEHAYKSVNTDVLAWVMSRATGHSYEQLLHERIWAPLGCEEDGYLTVDEAGMALACGGLSVTARDLARFGEMMRRKGDWGGKQVVPAAVVEEIERGGDRARFARAGYRTSPGYSYRNMWYTTHNELGAFEARGIHGTRLYIAPKAEW